MNGGAEPVKHLLNFTKETLGVAKFMDGVEVMWNQIIIVG